MQLEEIIQKAEEAAKARAAQAAYEISDGVGNRELQRTLFELCYNSVMHGTRIMQEELSNLINKEENGIK